MNSAGAGPSRNAQPQALLGTGRVRHLRLRPARHGFDYPTFFLLLPMRRLRAEPCHDLPRNRFGLVSFADRDHGDGRPDCLAWIEELLQSEGIDDAGGEIWLHCYPRVLGYVFKPVSLWYCHRTDGSLAAVLAEVNNTFGERHCYLLSGSSLAFGREATACKVFHVSPFCSIRGEYRFRFMRTDLNGSSGTARTVVRIEHHDAGGPLLLTSISGSLGPLTRSRLQAAFFGMPLMTLAVIARIHWQAFRLALKRVPFFAKPEPPEQFVTR